MKKELVISFGFIAFVLSGLLIADVLLDAGPFNSVTIGDGSGSDWELIYDDGADRKIYWDESEGKLAISTDLIVDGSTIALGGDTPTASMTFDTSTGKSGATDGAFTVAIVDSTSSSEDSVFQISSLINGSNRPLNIGSNNTGSQVIEWFVGSSAGLEGYTGTTGYRFWEGSRKYQFDNDLYNSKSSGALYLEDSGGNCYKCVIDTATITTYSEKSWFDKSETGTSGDTYIGGFYEFYSGNNDFTTTLTFPAAAARANDSIAAHLFVVLGAATVDELTIRVTGTSINDSGTRTTSDTEDIVIPTSTAANAYYETSKKWLGRVTIDHISGTAKTCNVGYSKYWDNSNTDFNIAGIEAVWLAGANDSDFNVALIHHKTTGWTYNAGSTPTPPAAVASLATDHSTDDEISNGYQGAWKRTNLNTDVSGSGSEGTIIRVTTTANSAVEQMTVLLRISTEVASPSNIACTAATCPS